VSDPYRVKCEKDGPVVLTKVQYLEQLDQRGEDDNVATWKCPKCGGPAAWDDENYTKWLDESDIPF
jgi:hypothetical protein